MNTHDLNDLPEGLLSLVPEKETAELGAGSPNEAVKPRLASLDLNTAFQPHKIVDPQMAAACHSGLWLAHNFLDESHTLSQSIDTPTGSFWHGIMHRREPDDSNAKYWFRRVGEHPIFEPLSEFAENLIVQTSSKELKKWNDRHISSSGWDPFAFIDLCSKYRNSNEIEIIRVAEKIQYLEMLLLLKESC